jgi:hypothetical protein
MPRNSPPEFRRRVVAAAISYKLQLNSIDYTLKRYIASDLYEHEDLSLGDVVSDYLRDSVALLGDELRSLHTTHPSFGIFGAEITLFRAPHNLDTARMLSNRGLLLEVLPILRLCLEMIAWSNVAFHMRDEAEVVELKAQSCITEMKNVYRSAGKIYGYLSRFTHWGHEIHGRFLDFSEQQVGVLSASVRYRATALALCLVILDILIEVVRKLYPGRSNALIAEVQGVLDRNEERNTYRLISSVRELTGLDELSEIQAFLK